jgi:hypothetical protein
MVVLVSDTLRPLFWKEARAEIEQVGPSEGRPGTTKTGAAVWGVRYKVHYAYQVEGRTYLGVDTVPTPPVGPHALVTVLYDPTKPSNSELSRPLRVNGELIGKMLLVLVIGLSMAWAGLSRLLKRRRTSRKR